LTCDDTTAHDVASSSVVVVGDRLPFVDGCRGVLQTQLDHGGDHDDHDAGAGGQLAAIGRV